MNTLLHSPASEIAPAAPSHTGRWMQVLSHIDPRYGGLSAAVPALASRLVGCGFDVSLAAFTAPGERTQPQELTPAQLSYWPAARRPWLTPSLRGAFRSQLRGLNGIHIHGLWEQSTSTAAAAAHSLRIPYILSAHGMLEPWALSQKRLKKLIYAALFERRNIARAACLHALTQAEARHYLAFGARSPIAVIPNAVTVPAHADPVLFLDAFPQLRGRRIVLFLARLHPKKGLHLLVQAWARVAAHYPEARLVIAGQDFEDTRASTESLIQAQAAAAGKPPADSILFTGMLNSVFKWSALAAAEAFVLPSLSEGLSVGALEAMGIGLPVIVTEPCNMPEVEEHRTGWLIQPSVAELTTALEQLLSNPPQRNAQIGSRGAELVRNRFSWPAVSSHFAELYDWVQGGPKPRSIQLIHP